MSFRRDDYSDVLSSIESTSLRRFRVVTGMQMKNLETTKWLRKVRDALAEEDEVRRSSMLRAADRFLKESNQQSLDIPLLSEGPL
jgi:hypothetical protein